MGGMAFFGEYAAYSDEAVRSQLPEAHQALYEVVPMWLYVVFGIAVLTGIIGSIGLLMKKKWATPVFLVSLIGVIIQSIYNLFISGAIEVIGTKAIIMPLIILGFALFIWYYSKLADSKGWLS